MGAGQAAPGAIGMDAIVISGVLYMVCGLAISRVMEAEAKPMRIATMPAGL